MSIKKVAVIGATGRLGRLAVQQLVDRGIQVNILSRQPPLPQVPSSISPESSSQEVVTYLSSLPGVSLVSGDVSSVDALSELVQDCQACLALFGATRRSRLSDLWKPAVAENDPTHAKQVNYVGVQNLVAACCSSPKQLQCRRIVRITGKGEDPTSIFSLLINTFGSMAKAWNYQGEQVLRESPLDYTIVRPGVMSSDNDKKKDNNNGASSSKQNSDHRLALVDNGGDLPVSTISYDDIASLCIESLDYPNAARTTLTAMMATDGVNEEHTATTWGQLLEKVQADRRVFPKDMLDQHFRAVRAFLLKSGALLGAVLAILVKLLFF